MLYLDPSEEKHHLYYTQRQLLFTRLICSNSRYQLTLRTVHSPPYFLFYLILNLTKTISNIYSLSIKSVQIKSITLTTVFLRSALIFVVLYPPLYL